MLTKMKKAVKDIKCFWNTSKNVRGSNNLNLKEIRELGAEIIATLTEDGLMDGRTMDESQFHELCWHSQAERITHSITYKKLEK